MNNQKVLATFVVAVLAASLLSVIGLSVPLRMASAQNVTITTSTDAHGNTFFGEGFAQVVITDPNADDDDTIEDITVTIDADPDVGSGASGTFTVDETSASSGKFELFLGHQTSDDVAVGALDPINSAGAAEFPVGGTQAPVIRFGAGGDLCTDCGPAESASFDFTVGNVEVTIDYDEMAALISLDRPTYGSTSLVYFVINDQDANLDPTNPDAFDVTEADINDDLFDINGATFVDLVTFAETGDNTALFEGIVTLTTADSGNDPELDFTTDSVQVTLFDSADYEPSADLNADNSTDTDDASFDIDDVDGDLTITTATVTFGTELKVSVDDNDANVDSEDDDTIDNGLIITSDGAGGDVVTVDLAEDDDNSGVFLPDVTNDEVKVTFVANSTGIIAGNSILELVRNATDNDITEDIIVAYNDTLNDDSAVELFETTVTITLVSPQVNLPENAGINDDFLLTITDMDFNDNPRTKDSYTFTLDGTGEYELFRGSTNLGEIASLEVDIEGDPVDFTTPLVYTLVETDINTGVFTTELDMADILDSAEVGGDPVDVDDGDRIEVTFNDFMDDVSREASDELAIGKATTGVDFSRTVIPIPPEAGSQWVGAGIDTTVFVTLIVTDADQNIQSSTEDNFRFAFEGDAADPDIVSEVFFTVEVETGTGDDLAIDTFAEYTGSVLEDVLPGLADDPGTATEEGILLSETGKSTGVFDDELEFEEGGIGLDEWQDMEITFNYIDADGDEESAGITGRGNDGTVTVDQDSVKSGDVLTITVQDEDLNLDDGTVEEFESATATDVDFIIAVETEDDEIGGVSTETLRETAADSGIFTATWTTGTDIPVTQSTGDSIEQATNILITFNDEVDSTGSSGDELEINVPVVTGTGAIQVQPELVGPGTEVTVLVTDIDLDEDPSGTENYDPEDPDSDDFFVSFRSDRDEVGDASPEIEETGPNTGVFEFQLELITEEGPCEDDDLGDAKFEAEGGSEPSIGTCPGDLIAVRYEDEQDASGRSTTVSAIIEVKSFDPEFSTDKDSYAVGERVTATIADADANRDPDIADSLTDIRLTSDSDRVGEEISALETGKNTGVFKLSFSTTSGTEGGAITVKTGDTVSIEYTDDYPADFEEEENDKEFVFTIQVGTGVTIDTTTMSAPSPVDPATGRELTTVRVGQQVALSTTILNNFDSAQPFVAMMEVRDSNGITQKVDFQSGTLEPSGQTAAGFSWTPSAPGDYTARTFAISSLTNPQIISELEESVVTVVP